VIKPSSLSAFDQEVEHGGSCEVVYSLAVGVPDGVDVNGLQAGNPPNKLHTGALNVAGDATLPLTPTLTAVSR
jgi:hypothetical protein